MKENKITKVSFDFDGTLNEHFSGESNPHKDEVQKLLVELFNNESFDVYIITRRFGPENSEKGNINEHNLVFELLNFLDIEIFKEKIIFTNRDYKFSTINALGIDIHFDDDYLEHDLIKRFTNCKSFNVQKESWLEEFKSYTNFDDEKI